jgi:hypothetical protein
MALREVKPSTNTFDELCAQYEFENGKKKRAEAALDKIRKAILTYHKKAANKAGIAESGIYRVTITSYDRETIDKGKLLQLGVRPAIIRKATKSTPVAFPNVTNLEEAARKTAEKAAKKEAAAHLKQRRA